jgi:predicted metal-dependent peptidase
MNDLMTRVLSAIPAGAYEMNALLSLLRIDETDTVPTACVSCERRPVLRINPEFVRRHCRTDEHLFLLVMHELHHVLLGHTRLFRRPTRAHNVAFDALINSMLVLRFPAEAYRSFFLDLYGAEDGPVRLLAPPAGAESPTFRSVDSTTCCTRTSG